MNSNEIGGPIYQKIARNMFPNLQMKQTIASASLFFS